MDTLMFLQAAVLLDASAGRRLGKQRRQQLEEIGKVLL
jgi:hypothetical protein